MKKLSTAQAQKRDELSTLLENKEDDIVGVVEEINTIIRERLNSMVDDYKELLAKADALVEEVTGEMEVYIGERNESWGDSDEGEAYISWKDEWESIYLDSDDIDRYDELEHLDARSHNLGALPENP